jgi:hypothetical protein
MFDPDSINHKIQETLVSILLGLVVTGGILLVWTLVLNPAALAGDDCCQHCPPVAAHGVELGELSRK